MASGMGIQFSFDFQPYPEIEAKLKTIIAKLQNNKIVINVDNLNQIENEISKIKQQLNGQSVNVDISKAVNQIGQLTDNVHNLQKSQVKIVDGEEVQLTENLKNNLIETQRIVTNLKNNKVTIFDTNDYAKAQSTLYSQLDNYQKQEYAIKQKMVGADTEVTAEYQKQLDLIAGQVNYNKQLLVDNNLVDDVKENDLLQSKAILQSNLNVKIDEANKAQAEQTAEIQKQIALYQEEMGIKIQNLQTRYEDLVDPKAISQLKTELDSLTTTNFNKGDISNEFKKIEANAKSASSALHTTNKDAMSLGSAFNQALEKFPIWIAASTLVMGLIHSFTNGLSEINSLNQALTQISIVTNQDQDATAKLGREYQKLAVTMGVLTEDIASASVEYYRQGLTAQQVAERMKTTIEYAKISSLNLSEASQIMTATVNSMGVSIEHAADVYSYLGRFCPLI